MTEQVHIIDPCTSAEWMQFIASHPDAGFFHHPAWMRMLQDIYGYRIFAICLKSGNAIRAGIPFGDIHSLLTGKRWISMPFSDHCQPLFPFNDPDAVHAMMNYLKERQGINTPKIEIRWGIKSSTPVYLEKHFVYHLLPLNKDPRVIYKALDKQMAQRSIRKAEREGVTVRQCTTFEEFDVFYRLQVITRKRLGVLAQPRTFFRGIWEYILKPGLGFALVSYKDTTPLAGGVFLKFGSTVYYKYGAMDTAYKTYRPVHAFMWKAIQRACTEGYAQLDFCRSESSNEGLKKFKTSWNAVEHELPYTIFSNTPPKSGLFKLDAVAGAVIRHSPEFVCTLSGELLYKHFV